MSFNDTQKAQVIEIAQDLNFWGKRTRKSKDLVIDQIADELFKGNNIAAIASLLKEATPAKAEKVAKAEKADKVPSFNEQDQHFNNAPCLPDLNTRIVYSVQNNAAINPLVFKTVEMIAQSMGAELCPVRCSYIVEKDDEADHTMALCQPAPVWYGSDVLILGGDVLPTAKKPISNASLMSGDRLLTVLPHPKQQAVSLPRPKGSLERWAVTTGTVCHPRYKASRAGAEASAAHTYGFTVIDSAGGFEQVQLDAQGCGYYRGVYISPNGFDIKKQFGRPVIIAGDIHAEKLDQDGIIFAELLNLINETGAGSIVTHDICDFESRNHHNRGSGLFLASQMGKTIADDLEAVGGVLSEILESTTADVIIVNSNHDRALDRWLEETDPRQDPINLPLWCDLQKPRYISALTGENNRNIPLESALHIVCPYLDYSRITFLQRDESFMKYGVELGHHGDAGINGARGGFTAFERLGGSYVIGHSHSGYKNGSSVAVGGVTGSFDMGYNVGASSWSHSHVIVTPDGAMQIIK